MAIGRFQVMAILQAARAYVLGLPLPMAKSWGLNRAIFYAAAKRGFKRMRMPPARPRSTDEISQKPVERKDNVFYLGDEYAYITQEGDKVYFMIGNKPQTEEDFYRQVESRFGKAFQKVWEEAVRLVEQFSPKTLLSQREFYNRVYLPRRDILAKKWSELVKEMSESGE